MPSTAATPDEVADAAPVTGADPAVKPRRRHTVTVRYWAGARAAAGRDNEVVDLELSPAQELSVGVVLAEVAARHTSLVAVLAVAAILLDGRAVGPEDLLPDGATLEVLPPFAGG